jgi:hypothetical protein
MINIPFVYFFSLFIFVVMIRKRLDVVSCLLLLYSTTSFFTILIDKFNYYDGNCPKTEITIGPLVMYLFLLSLSIYPFYNFDLRNVLTIKKIKNEDFFIKVCILYILCFFLFFILTFNEIVVRLVIQEATESKDLLNEGEIGLGFENYPLPVFLIGKFSYIIGQGSMIMIVFFFYSLSFLKKKLFFNLLLLLSSTTTVVIGIISFDRSKTIYWLLIFLLNLAVFWPYIKKRNKKVIYTMGLSILSLMLVYLFSISNNRYSESSIGSGGYFINYAGQSFINFNVFINKIDLNEYNFYRIFPLLSRIFGEVDGGSYMDWASHISSTFHVNTRVFATFAGVLISEIGLWWCFVYILVFHVLTRRFLKRPPSITLSAFILLYIFVVVPFLGTFGSFYGMYEREIAVLIYLYIISKLKYGEKAYI